MQAGRLDQRIAIESPSDVPDELGQEHRTWAVEAEVWARLMETPGREFLSGDYRPGENAVFVIRYRTVDSTWRVRWGGRIWRIESVTGTLREGLNYLHCVSIGEAG